MTRQGGWFVHDVAVRFRDIDAMGHAHHTLPLIYLEEARAAFWRDVKGDASIESIDYVMAEVTLRFHGRIRYPSTLAVALAVSRVGDRSFTTVFEVRGVSSNGADYVVLSSGTAVQVAYDYSAAASRALDANERERLNAWLAAYQKSVEISADTSPITAPRT